MPKVEFCELWNKEVRRTEEKGFSMDRECPVSQICDKENCLIINGPRFPGKVIYQEAQNELQHNTVVINS